MLKSLIKKFTPKFLLSWYHLAMAILAKWLYDNPSGKLIVIGVTGTAGKSSTCYFIAQILEAAGIKTGMTTTTLFKIGDQEWLNDKKMTMLGRFQTQKMLARMVKAGCWAAVVETSSQGVEQCRHRGINYDIALITNLYPEHIEAHGGFENYKQAKGKFFKRFSTQKNKTTNPAVKKTIIVNMDDEHADYFLSFPADRKIGYTLNADLKKSGLEIFCFNNKWRVILLGAHNKYNILAAATVAKVIGINDEVIARAVPDLRPLPGRLEKIENNLGINIIVDYAFEPGAMKKIYETIDKLPHNKLIQVLGSAGGTAEKAMQRDKSRRPILGKMAAENADTVIVTNEDPYDEDPKKIIGDVVSGAMADNFQFPISSEGIPMDSSESRRDNFQINLKFQIPNSNKSVYAILDRREAIHTALELAEKGDLVLITGKGAEQAMCVAGGKRIKWDDREVIREELEKIKVAR